TFFIGEHLSGLIAEISRATAAISVPCVPVFLFQHHDAHALGTALLMGALFLHGNISTISGNVSAISRVCGGMRSLG
ncbi:MAG: hypothetical protein WBX95_04355, partial [Xanthobacteraceae bacterium]